MPLKRVAVLVIVAATLVGAACGEARETSHAASGIGPLQGRTPSGARYVFSVTAKRGGDLCERLQIRQGGQSSGSSTCQSSSGQSMHGQWDLDCTSKDFVVYGTAYRHVATVLLRTSSGIVVHARLQRHGRRQAFVLIASGRKLPGRVEALSSTGKVLRRMTFHGSTELCRSDAGVDNPLEVTYPF